MPGTSVSAPSGGGGSSTPASAGNFPPGVHRELSLILKEIRVITDKVKKIRSRDGGSTTVRARRGMRLLLVPFP